MKFFDNRNIPTLLKIDGRNKLFVSIYFLLALQYTKEKKGNDININENSVISWFGICTSQLGLFLCFI